MKRQLEAVRVLPLPHGLEPVREPFGVAVVASGTQGITSCGRIPRCAGPFYGRFIGHGDLKLEN